MSARKLPPSEHVIALVQEHGWSMGKVAERYGCSRQAVTYAFRQAGLGDQRTYADYRPYIPWRVRVAHNMDKPVRMIRLWARTKMGMELRPADRAALDQYLTMLRNTDRVIAYDPDDGFYLVQRRPEDGDGIVRVP